MLGVESVIIDLHSVNTPTVPRRYFQLLVAIVCTNIVADNRVCCNIVRRTKNCNTIRLIVVAVVVLHDVIVAVIINIEGTTINPWRFIFVGLVILNDAVFACPLPDSIWCANCLCRLQSGAVGHVILK